MVNVTIVWAKVKHHLAEKPPFKNTILVQIKLLEALGKQFCLLNELLVDEAFVIVNINVIDDAQGNRHEEEAAYDKENHEWQGRPRVEIVGVGDNRIPI